MVGPRAKDVESSSTIDNCDNLIEDTKLDAENDNNIVSSDDVMIVEIPSGNQEYILIEDAVEEVVTCDESDFDISESCPSPMLISDEDVELESEDLLLCINDKSSNLDSSPDLGYESLDSPGSDSDHLQHLFPEIL
jgi:hypothetical protein